MRWFDSDYDYVQELKEAWERGKKKIRNAYLILAAVLLAAGILLAWAVGLLYQKAAAYAAARRDVKRRGQF